MKKILKYGPLFIVIAALLWSFDGLLRTTLYALPPSVVVFWEHLLGAIVLIPFLIKRQKEVFKMTRREWIAIVFVGLFSGALGTIFYTAALGKVNYIQFSVVVLLQQLQPIWTIATAALLLKEPLTKRFLGWAGVAIVASYFVTFKDLHVNMTPGNQTLIAALLALAAGMMWGSSTAFSKIVLNKVSFWTATFLRFWIAPAFALLFIFGLHQQQAIFALNQSQWLAILTIVFSTGMVALLIYYYGLRSTPARVSTILELVWPASAIFIGYFYFHQGLSLTQILGVVVLLTAIYNVSKVKK